MCLIGWEVNYLPVSLYVMFSVLHLQLNGCSRGDTVACHLHGFYFHCENQGWTGTTHFTGHFEADPPGGCSANGNTGEGDGGQISKKSNLAF